MDDQAVAAAGRWAARATVRFETGPGEQAQVAFQVSVPEPDEMDILNQLIPADTGFMTNPPYAVVLDDAGAEVQVPVSYSMVPGRHGGVDLVVGVPAFPATSSLRYGWW